ncbi:MAG: ABC transporter permease [Armatimonadetes bacterium]|nr:ABC transporter permease [Armatimonadota bacterium]
MNTRRLIMRSLLYYWRTGVMVAFGVAIAAAVIVGSLVIGDSVKGSLRDTALARLGNTDYALVSTHFFRQALAYDLIHDNNLASKVKLIAPIVITRGSAANAMSNASVPNAGVIGVDDSFWQLWGRAKLPLSQRQAAISESLANDLNLKIGDSLLINIDKQSAIPSGTLFEHRSRDEALSSIRLEVAAILPDNGVGGFRLSASTDTPRNVFISREWLLSEIGKKNVANAMLVESNSDSGDIERNLKAALAAACTLSDYGLKLVRDSKNDSVSLQSEGMLLSDSQVDIARSAAADCGIQSALASVYLATTIKKHGTANGIPYSIIAAVEGVESGKWKAESKNDIRLNSWAASDIGAKIGDKIDLTYLVSAPDGTYHDASITLTLARIIDMSDPANNRDLVPIFEGITDADSIDEWKAPFPIDMNRIRPKDEVYWEAYKTTPKAYVSMETAKELWAKGSTSGENAGWVTSIRLQPNISAIEDKFASSFIAKTKPAAAGMVFQPVRQLALAASAGATDFGQLFLSMSFFLVIAGAGLAGTLMRLSADRRASQTGIMMACGFDSRQAGKIVMGEGICLTAAGMLIGVPLGILYAWAIMAALRSWWIGAVGTSALWLHVTPASVLMGAISGLAVGIVSIAWGIKGLSKTRVLDLLAGWQAMGVLNSSGVSGNSFPKLTKHYTRSLLVFSTSLAVAIVLFSISTIAKTIPPTGAFFGCGALLLIAGIAAVDLTLARALCGIFRPISTSMLALRSAAANPGRSLLVVGLIAAASFMIIAVAANTWDFTRTDYTQKSSGTGGFALRAISSLPIRYDFGAPAGREALGFPAEDEKIFKNVHVYKFLMSPGDDISCLNLAKTTQPRMLGVSPEFIERGGFNVTSPWAALDQNKRDTISVFGDASSVQWSLHSGLGKTLALKNESGSPVNVRFEGLLNGSIFASEILSSERNFRQLFPNISAPRYFLVEIPKGMENKVTESLRANLGDMGLEVRSTREVLNSYMAVQNTYLSVFLALGGLGLLLGTVGLVAVVLRSALERKREFALMLATGFTKAHLSRILIMENAGLLLIGLICGTISALVAVAPHIASTQSKINWGIIFALLAAIAAVGLISCAIAARNVVNDALVQALREE